MTKEETSALVKKISMPTDHHEQRRLTQRRGEKKKIKRSNKNKVDSSWVTPLTGQHGVANLGLLVGLDPRLFHFVDQFDDEGRLVGVLQQLLSALH